MSKYIVFECKECETKVMYPSYTADGHNCRKCGSSLILPIDEGAKVDMKFKWFQDDDICTIPETKTAIMYKCDRRACHKCSPQCEHTTDIRHAKNFELQGNVFTEI